MNILIVDDEADSREEIAFYVDKYGGFNSCEVCANPLAALEQAAAKKIDIALLDIEMPFMNGLELAERLMSEYPDMVIAFITAYNHYAAEAFEVNAIDYILKPISEERLYRALNKLKEKKLEKPQIQAYPGRLSIHMFGKFMVKIDGTIVKWSRQKSCELFAYLLENKEYPIYKEKLCELLWPDKEPKKALMNLQAAMHSLRKILEADVNHQILIEYFGNNYTLYIKDDIIDVEQFENTLQRGLALKDSSLIKQAISLYTADYLEEEGWLWAEPRKVMLRNQYISALKQIKQMK